MLVSIERGESVDAKQWSQQECLKAALQRLLPVMQQRKVVVGMRSLMGLDRLLELVYNWAKCPVLIEPMRKEMHANTQQTGRDPHERCAGENRWTVFGLARATLGPVELP